MSSETFSESEFLRYSRHLQLPQVGTEGQLKLKQAKVTIVGCGGLGAPVGLYLAAAGIGHITLIDDDDVELSNLQRQIIFTQSDIGTNKASAARKRLLEMNSDIAIETRAVKLTEQNAESLLSETDLVLDCSDNFSARYAINDYCKWSSTPWVYASIHQFSGQCALFAAEGPCFRCLFPTAPTRPQDCSQAGVLGVLPGILGTIQALEAIKHILALEGNASGKLLLVESLQMQTRKISISSDPGCPTCLAAASGKRFYEQAKSAGAENERQPIETIDKQALQSLLADGETALIDVRQPSEHNAFNIGGINIPLDQLSNEKLPDKKAIVFYCQVGARSAQAAQLARQEDLNLKIYSLEGGLNRYMQDKH